MAAIDVWAQITTPRMAAEPWLAPLLRWTGQDERDVLPSVDSTLRSMDAAGVSLSLLSAWYGPNGPLISNEEVAEQIGEAPERFRGLAAVDLRDPMGAVRDIRRWVDGETFVGVRIVPWLWELPPNHRSYYPVYVSCVEAGVPVCTQIGHTGPLRSSEFGRLIPYLDDVLLDFPELTIVAGHVGFPWIDEVVSLAHKYPNFFVDTSAYSLHRLPRDFVEFMRGYGSDRVLFGTNWPMISPTRCLRGLDELDLTEEQREAFLSGNATRVFNLSL
ncbi:MAG: amidohydrolase family protein [Acidimicrobiales bacterium]